MNVTNLSFNKDFICSLFFYVTILPHLQPIDQIFITSFDRQTFVIYSWGDELFVMSNSFKNLNVAQSKSRFFVCSNNSNIFTLVPHV